MNLTKKMLLSACILASGITNTVVCAELISPIPRIYIEVPSPGGEHFEKKALSLINSKDLQNCAPYLGSIQQQLTDFLSRIKTPSSPLQINVVPHSSKITMMDQKENEKSDAIYDEDSTSDEIKQLKSYLQIPLSSQISLSELKVAKAEFDISITQVLFETPITSEEAFRSVNSSLSYFLSVCQYDSDKIFDPVFLYILMRMFIDYPSKLDRQIVVGLNKTSINKEVEINESIEHYRENGIKIYEWLQEKDDGILGEYHI